MENRTQYFTTPIYYVNAQPHLGHAYTTIAADVATRFKQMDGHDTYFLTGTDEHGDKIVQAAQKQNQSPQEYVNKISRLFQDLWPRLSVQNNQFIRTTDPAHIQVVENLLTRIHDKGDIYFSSYEGQYCFGCERFYQDRELVEGKCPDHGVAPATIKESNYFFKMGQYQDWLIDHIKTHPGFIHPRQYETELLSFLKEPLEDLCISRPKSRLTWGITLPFDSDYVTYVWFDALVNYISAPGYPDGRLFKKFWPSARHFVAKDIIKPHGIYWPIMLKAAGIDIYAGLNVHGFWNVSGSKMSKSVGNVTDPVAVTDRYGVDAFRYFLMREMVFGLDANFTEDVLVSRINADLANDLGNLFSRVLSMNIKYFKGVVPEMMSAPDISLASDAQAAVDGFQKAMARYEFHKAVTAVWQFVSSMNKYIDMHEPWKLAKEENKHPLLAAVICNLLEGLRTVACLIYPVMPGTSGKMLSALGMTIPGKGFFLLDEIPSWGQVRPGTILAKPPILFPRIDVPATDAPEEKTAPANKKKGTGFTPEIKPVITMEDFAKIDLRTGSIRAAEKIAGSDKLIKLQVDLGTDTRQVVAGIGRQYTPKDLVGRQVVVVANLKQATLMGEDSQGMILAAGAKKELVLAGFDTPMPPGSPVK
ncbi:MAG: methionine--tRNA ligase [Desulfotignum sp.]|jgi:methionyl-tRNA synthetase|nr:methionine--tRNA ligase [Desulfotignum sp.]